MIRRRPVLVDVARDRPRRVGHGAPEAALLRPIASGLICGAGEAFEFGGEPFDGVPDEALDELLGHRDEHFGVARLGGGLTASGLGIGLLGRDLVFARRQHGFTRLERRFARVQVAQCSTFGAISALERLDSGFEGRFEGAEVKLRVERPVRRDSAGGVGLALHVEELPFDCPIARVGVALALARPRR